MSIYQEKIEELEKQFKTSKEKEQSLLIQIREEQNKQLKLQGAYDVLLELDKPLEEPVVVDKP